MPGRDFVIEEIAAIGGAIPAGGFAKFVWTAKNRNIPFKPWNFGVELRTVRTDYPGADDPTEQVLGPNFTPFTLNGVWDDKYNPQSRLDPNNADDLAILRAPVGSLARLALGGYAELEQLAFENMVRRGNPVRITFEQLTIQGLITGVEFSYEKEWRIGYSFTFSPHHRQPGGAFSISRSPRTVLNSTQLRNEANDIVNTALEVHTRVPVNRLTGNLFNAADTLLEEWVTQIAGIDLSIEKRQLNPEQEANASLLRLAANFFSLSTTAVNLISLLESLDSTEAMDFEAGIGQLDYDVWARGLQDVARAMVVSSQRASSELQQRAQPNALALYSPQAGESLYSISNRFYRTPHNWRLIATRNGLNSLILAGTELLVIPEVTGR